MASPVKDEAWLEWIASLMGAASRQRQTAMLPPQQFHCLLDELPLHLIPRRHAARAHDPAQALFLNPDCLILPSGEVPAEFEAHKDLLESFSLQGPIAWVRDAATSVVRPFWLGPKLEAALSGLNSGEPDSASMPEAARLLLAEAGILTPADHARQRRAQWSEIVQARSHLFREKDYVPLRGLLHPFHLAALRRYYRRAIRRNNIWLGDEQSPRRYVAHNEPVARYFHRQIAKPLSDIVGEPIKPSYVYLASYLSGAELKKHTDRDQCEFSVTLCLDFSPEPELETPWPIRLDTPAGTVTVFQALGDALVYQGTKVPHYRDVLGEGLTSTSIFFHYVRADFSGPLD